MVQAIMDASAMPLPGATRPRGDQHALIALRRIVEESDPEAEQTLEAWTILAADTGAAHSR